MARNYDNNELLNLSVQAVGYVGDRIMDNNLLLNILTEALQNGGGGGGSTGGGDYRVVSNLDEITSPQEGTIAYVKSGTKSIKLVGVGIEGIDRSIENYNSGAKIFVDGNNVYNNVYIEHYSYIYTNISGKGMIPYNEGWVEIAENLFVKGISTGKDDHTDTNAKFYVAQVEGSGYNIYVSELDTDKYPNAQEVAVDDTASVPTLPYVKQYYNNAWIDMHFNEIVIDNSWSSEVKANYVTLIRTLYKNSFTPTVKIKKGNDIFSFTKFNAGDNGISFGGMNDRDYYHAIIYNNGVLVDYQESYGNIIATVTIENGQVTTDDSFSDAIDNFRRNPNSGRALIRLIYSENGNGTYALAHAVKEFYEGDVAYRSADFIVEQQMIRVIKNLNNNAFTIKKWDISMTEYVPSGNYPTLTVDGNNLYITKSDDYDYWMVGDEDDNFYFERDSIADMVDDYMVFDDGDKYRVAMNNCVYIAGEYSDLVIHLYNGDSETVQTVTARVTME